MKQQDADEKSAREQRITGGDLEEIPDWVNIPTERNNYDSPHSPIYITYKRRAY